MRIVITGGGTGGHVTPLKSVVAEIRAKESSAEVLFIAQKNDRFADLIDDDEVEQKFYVNAGKYRRYPDEPLYRRMFDVKTHALNAIDIVKTMWATLQAYRSLGGFKPDVVFGNGGFVSVPVGWAAKLRGIPVVIHESDARPGLATRLLASNASQILFGVPTRTTTVKGRPAEFVGIPLRDAFLKKEKASQAKLKEKIGYDPKKPLVTIAGSSLGAEAINNAVIGSIKQLMEATQVAHITGEDHHAEVAQAISDSGVVDGYKAISFTSDIDLYFKASDIVINRASATVFAELAQLGKPTILIPAPQLSDQIENAEILEEKKVVWVIDQNELQKSPELLVNRIDELLSDDTEIKRLQKAIHELATPDAAKDLADILLSFGDSDG